MNYSKTAVFLLLLTLLAANFLRAQTPPAPTKQEKLLNGLKVLIWNEPKAEKVSLRLRIHSGSAFDPKDKMGVMALVTDILFPTEQTKNFFEEDLEGSLEVVSNYDYIQINATAKSDEFLTILETVATVVANPSITQENFVKVRDARLKAVEEMQKNPAYVADTAIAKRLLGDFPYGRPQAGTPESLKLIDRPDLLTAKDKFFTADNATLAITGNVKPEFAYMAARRLFGAWKKADKLVPATFRQPDDPNAETLKIPFNNPDKELARVAFEGLARNDKDYFSFVILTKALQARLNKFPDGFVKYEPHLLRGIVIWGISFADKTNWNAEKAETGKIIKPEEFEKAKADLLNELNQKNIADRWLDVDTFKLVSVKDELQKAGAVTLADVQRVFEKSQKLPNVTVWLEKAEEKK
jgi:zinc protease